MFQYFSTRQIQHGRRGGFVITQSVSIMRRRSREGELAMRTFVFFGSFKPRWFSTKDERVSKKDVCSGDPKKERKRKMRLSSLVAGK